MSVLLNMDPGAPPVVVTASEGDVGRIFTFQLIKDGMPCSYPSATVTAEILKSDGHGTSIPCTWSGSEVMMVTTEQSTIRAGKANCELRIVSDNYDIGTANFILAVEPRPINADTDQTDSSYSQTGDPGDVWTLGSNGVPSWSPSGLDATTATAGQVLTADGNGGHYWGTVIGGGGQPTPVTLASEMEDTEKLYLYLGNESGYQYGYIYAHTNGAWTSTGLYGKGEDGANGTDGYSPTALVSQTATGVSISVTDKNGTTIATVENGTATQEQVDTWLDEHPEATTTVTDGSITFPKLSKDVKADLEEKIDVDSITKHLSLGKVNDTLYVYWNGVQIGMGVPLSTGGGDVTPEAYEDIVLSDNKLYITTTANDPTLIDGTLYFV